MNPMLAAITAALLLCSSSLYGLTCSGGTAGGMDATGCECNSPPEEDASESSWTRAMAEYDVSRYADAVVLLQRAAYLGHIRAAETLAMMYRHGERLYGYQGRADPAKAAHFAALAARLRAMSGTAASGANRSATEKLEAPR